MTIAEKSQKVTSPRWLHFWLACLPATLFAALVALLGLFSLHNLPRWTFPLLGFYALTQLLPAIVTPEPVLALGGAFLRTALMFGLLGLGAAMGQTRRLWPLALGLIIVYLTALGFNVVEGLDVFVSRLTHPYMTPITLGLAGALGIWLALFSKGHLAWRVPLGLLGGTILLLSGSRGPLLAVLIGSLAAFVLRRRQQALAVLLLTGLLAGASVTVGERLGINLLTRLTQTDTSGRDVVWSNTLSVIRAHPLTGVGSYRLGARLTPPGEPCAIFDTYQSQDKPPTCPPWLARLGNPWLIAHNIALQQLAETGPLGLLGLMVLLTAVTVVTLMGRDPFAVAVVTGLLVATVNDNTLLVPSPFFAEVFWLVAGTQLAAVRHPSFGWKEGLLGVGLSLMLCAPLWVARVLPSTEKSPIAARLSYFNAPATAKSKEPYSVYVQFSVPDGKYRAVLKSCPNACVTLKTVEFYARSGQSDLMNMTSKVGTSGTRNLVLQLLPGKATFRFPVIAQKTWTVQVQP
ncbi:O-antigen ligase family protein [Deinococcus sp. VB142]|uniref:O-antigen ligase family protein n=1 Tax=Deinococcus sp. VB142 TaxID=3112952 RepID=A0AAU6PYF9_9DEIO